MNKYNLIHFNEIDPDNVEEYYEAEIAYDGHTIDADINFDTNSIGKGRLVSVGKFIDGLSKYDQKAIAAIVKDFKGGGVVADYIDYHIRELDDDTLNALLKNSDKDFSTREQMVAMLHLNRIGFYPDNDEGFATFDYTIDKDITDYLVVVKFTERGKIEYVLTES